VVIPVTGVGVTVPPLLIDVVPTTPTDVVVIEAPLAVSAPLPVASSIMPQLEIVRFAPLVTERPGAVEPSVTRQVGVVATVPTARALTVNEFR
jgi:hypothetical protein